MRTRYLELSEHLEALAGEIENKRSAEHSRLLILAAASRLAGKVDYPEFRVPDVCRMCDISRATFYLHFTAKEDLFVELMQHLTELECSLTPSFSDCPDIATAIDSVVDWYMDVHLANASLFANLTYLQRTNEAISDSWRERGRRLHDALIVELERFKEFTNLDKTEANFVLELIGIGMNVLVNSLSMPPPRNRYLPADVSATKRAVSKVFFRALFGAEPKKRPVRKANVAL